GHRKRKRIKRSALLTIKTVDRLARLAIAAKFDCRVNAVNKIGTDSQHGVEEMRMNADRACRRHSFPRRNDHVGDSSKHGAIIFADRHAASTLRRSLIKCLVWR